MDRATTVPESALDSCLARIRASLPELDGVRLRVAECILRAPWTSYGLSIGELADRCEVSENAVNRFARSLGYSGYRSFSQALSLDLGRTLGVFHSQPLEVIRQVEADPSDVAALVTRVFEMEGAALRETAKALDADQIRDVVSVLAGARKILFAGTGSAAPLCQMADYRSSNLGLNTKWTSDPMVMISEVSGFSESDVVVAISYTGQGRAVLETMSYARRRHGATTIAITGSQRSRICEHADHCLVFGGAELSAESGQFTARTIALVLLEAIITAVGVERFGTVPPTLDELGDMQSRINNVDSKWIPATDA